MGTLVPRLGCSRALTNQTVKPVLKGNGNVGNASALIISTGQFCVQANVSAPSQSDFVGLPILCSLSASRSKCSRSGATAAKSHHNKPGCVRRRSPLMLRPSRLTGAALAINQTNIFEQSSISSQGTTVKLGS